MEIKLFFKDTFEYNWQCNQKLIQLFEDIERTIPEKIDPIVKPGRANLAIT
ncbi:hypothetical protein [Flavobacterium nitratireducens]|uniref:hypothetical protein n=1 Tax=Flavobacterium nitratireducens TaxID=992289 RepID=UPI0024153F7E|nr:hypothetical protein [Flavobacterium nitratireducens]